MLTDLAATASSSVPVGQNFSALLNTFTKTQGFQQLMSFIYNTTGSLNGFDKFGHFQRSNLQLSTCVEIVPIPAGGCEAFFSQGATASPKKKKKKGKKARVSKAHLRSATPLPQVNVPNLQQLIPQLDPGQAPESSGSGSGTTTTTPQGDSTKPQAAGNQAVSMRSAQMFLQFLLGDGA
jgi:hypothetical protein